MKKTVVIFGATSAIAFAMAKLYAKQGANLCLIARNSEQLTILKQDLTARYQVSVVTILQDLNDILTHEALLNQMSKQYADIDIAIIAHGTLSPQSVCQSDVACLIQEYQTNCLSYLSLLTRLANYFETRQKGSLVAITSVAGDRGRQSNYVYGSAKAAVSAFLSGLTARLSKKNIHVLTVKPGFVDTPMVAHIKKNRLFAQPDHVAHDIVTAIERKKNVLYTPGFWRWIMLGVKLIPECIFKRLTL